ncbi:hypothetical protein ACUXAV_005105 [Cupriavidus metallidurans]|uniref:hypothetical protein n=1 Tax=Cupriavidus metallidurans TaxID=119219 RepID=UPI0004938A67|nr:hypothetical protein [Cupriavidus metallidurans]MDE4917761.1 hypothetical protein [Cupriavidus metallidurans]
MATENKQSLATALDVAAFIERKADDFADRFGFGVGGSLTFDNQEKLDYYTGLGELAEEIRALAAPVHEVAPCKHYNSMPRYDHTECLDCGSVLADSDWGIASNKRFKSLEEARFYQKHGRLPEAQP